MNKANGILFIQYTETDGRYYFGGVWIGEFYVDAEGNRRDVESNVIL